MAKKNAGFNFEMFPSIVELIRPTVESYGWSCKIEESKIICSNRNGKEVFMLDKFKDFSLGDKVKCQAFRIVDGAMIMSMQGQMAISVEKIIRDYYYGKKN